MDCCHRINLSSNGDALKAQEIRFGKYTKIAKADTSGHFIYQHEYRTDRSTLMQDSSGEWKVYNGNSTTPRIDRQVITSGCREECVKNCNGHNYKYLDGNSFVNDKTIKIRCATDSGEGLGLWSIAIVIPCVCIVFVIAYLVWRFYCKHRETKPEPENFIVEINGNSQLHKTITLPTDEYKLVASCKTNNPDIESQPIVYQYKWAYNGDQNDIVGDKKEYLARELAEGDHEYTAIVSCGQLERENTAKVTVISGAKVKHIRSETQYKCMKAETGRAIWLDKRWKITTLPEILTGSVIFPLPFDMMKKISDIVIEVNEKSDIYIAQISEEQDSNAGRSRFGWSSTSLENIGFVIVENVKVETDLWLTSNYCNLSLYKKDEKFVAQKNNDNLSLPRAVTDESLVAIFVKKAYNSGRAKVTGTQRKYSSNVN